MIEPAWAWVFTDAHGAVLDRPLSPVFASRLDAELWLGERGRDIARGGVASAGLEHEGAAIGVPVALTP